MQQVNGLSSEGATTQDFPESSYKFLGYSIFDRGTVACIDAADKWIGEGDSCKVLACLNPHSFVLAQGNDLFSEALKNADWVVPDGIGIVYASRLLGGTVRYRVTGSDVFSKLMGLNNSAYPKRVFFLGSTDAVLRLIRERAKRDFPRVEIVGTLAPPFSEEFDEKEDEAMIDRINRSTANVLWVGMTSPKQDIWLYRNKDRLSVKFAAGIGAAFDFYAGTVNRPGIVSQRIGIEWLVRLMRDPKRLWRRTLHSAPNFLAHVIRHRLKTRRRLLSSKELSNCTPSNSK